MIIKSDSHCAVVKFCYHLYDYRLNLTPLSPITVTYLCLIRGACGEVRLAFSKGNCKKFAVKIISKKTFSVGVSFMKIRHWLHSVHDTTVGK